MVLMVAVGCGGDKDGSDSGAEPTDTAGDTDAQTGPATLHLSFDLDPDLIPTMDEPAAGTFKGSVFAEADASAVGPNEGAVPLADFESEPIDFDTTGGVRANLATVGPIDAQIVWILGCLDSDANECDTHDAITVPNLSLIHI